MTLHDGAQYIVFFFLFIWTTILLGRYMVKIFHTRVRYPILGHIEEWTFRISQINPLEQMDGKQYGLSLLLFNTVGFLFLFLILKFQHLLPLNPQGFPGLSLDLAFNAAISFVTNTNWQPYAPETTLSYFSHTLGLTVQNFLAPGTSMGVLLALIRGLTNRRMEKLGNFWVDLVRTVIYLLLPLALLLSIFLVSQGVIQNFSPYLHIETIEGREQTLPLGPAASQVAIKLLGSGGGGFFSASSAHPFENPTPLSNTVEMLSMLLLPASATYLFGVMVKSRKQGWMLFIVMLTVWIAGSVISLWSENLKNPIYADLGSHWEGKEMRIGVVSSIRWGGSATATSDGAVNAMLSSYFPISGGIDMLNMMYGESIFGGLGNGLTNMIMLVLFTVFLSGLMAGRTPEYLGKKIERGKTRWIIVALMFPSAMILIGAAVACAFPDMLSQAPQKGPHGLTEIVYAFTSTAMNNGSAFMSLNTNTPLYNIALGFVMLLGRIAFIFPGLIIGVLLSRKRITPPTSGMIATDSITFGVLLVCIILLIGTLTFFPVLALGPLLEHLLMLKGQTF